MRCAPRRRLVIALYRTAFGMSTGLLFSRTHDAYSEEPFERQGSGRLAGQAQGAALIPDSWLVTRVIPATPLIPETTLSTSSLPAPFAPEAAVVHAHTRFSLLPPRPLCDASRWTLVTVCTSRFASPASSPPVDALCFKACSAAHRPSSAPAATSEGQWLFVSTRDQPARTAKPYQSYLCFGY